MKDKLAATTPQVLHPGEWHSPFDDNPKRSSACCARTSYKNHDGTNRTEEKDLSLYKSLKSLRHMSPFEHQAVAMKESYVPDCGAVNLGEIPGGITHIDRFGAYWSGNFCGWVQHRQLIERGCE